MPMLPDWTVQVLQVLVILGFAPLITRVIARAEAIIQQRRGPRVLQPYYDIYTLLGKETVLPAPAGPCSPSRMSAAAHDGSRYSPPSPAQASPPHPDRMATKPLGESRRPRIDRSELAAIAAGGAVGALARVGLSQAFPTVPGQWPWVTFAINVAAAFLLGYLATRLQERLPLSTLRRPLLGTGFCGAFSTFSTIQLELLGMIDRHHYALAGGYVAASVFGGYLGVFAATAIVRRVRLIA